MKLVDEIDDLIKSDQGRFAHDCSVKFVIEQFGGEDKKAIIRLIDHSNVPAPKIGLYLATKGHVVSTAKINNHRRRLKRNGTGCSCPVEL